MAGDVRLPGMPRVGVDRIALEVRLWEGGATAILEVASGPSAEEAECELGYYSAGYPLEESEQLVHAWTLLLKHIVREATGPFSIDPTLAAIEGWELYGHLMWPARVRGDGA